MLQMFAAAHDMEIVREQVPVGSLTARGLPPEIPIPVPLLSTCSFVWLWQRHSSAWRVLICSSFAPIAKRHVRVLVPCVSFLVYPFFFHLCFPEFQLVAQITRVIIERLIVQKPHPWGLLVTLIELGESESHALVLHAPGAERALVSLPRVASAEMKRRLAAIGRSRLTLQSQPTRPPFQNNPLQSKIRRTTSGSIRS